MNDKKYIILYFGLSIIFIIIEIYSIIYKNNDNLLPFDKDGNHCGNKLLKQYNKVYFYDITNRNFMSYTLCVKDCPIKNENLEYFPIKDFYGIDEINFYSSFNLGKICVFRKYMYKNNLIEGEFSQVFNLIYKENSLMYYENIFLFNINIFIYIPFLCIFFLLIFILLLKLIGENIYYFSNLINFILTLFLDLIFHKYININYNLYIYLNIFISFCPSIFYIIYLLIYSKRKKENIINFRNLKINKNHYLYIFIIIGIIYITYILYMYSAYIIFKNLYSISNGTDDVNQKIYSKIYHHNKKIIFFMLYIILFTFYMQFFFLSFIKYFFEYYIYTTLYINPNLKKITIFINSLKHFLNNFSIICKNSFVSLLLNFNPKFIFNPNHKEKYFDLIKGDSKFEFNYSFIRTGLCFVSGLIFLSYFYFLYNNEIMAIYYNFFIFLYIGLIFCNFFLSFMGCYDNVKNNELGYSKTGNTIISNNIITSVNTKIELEI